MVSTEWINGKSYKIDWSKVPAGTRILCGYEYEPHTTYYCELIKMKPIGIGIRAFRLDTRTVEMFDFAELEMVNPAYMVEASKEECQAWIDHVFEGADW